jgi:protein-S-isoprenylcysteine O-methyltransferase Ste14/pimeloyl-ACP methyl ester carboxylesterase
MRLPIRFLRALAAFLALPGVIAFAVPLLIAWPAPRDHAAFHVLGLVPLLAGIALLLWCVREFYVAGKGTLAPWDPPRHLVTTGPYRVSRNPMYIAVTLILIGWTIGYGFWSLLLYLFIVMAAFVLRVRFGEEPWLADRHYGPWRQYAARTPRWLFRSRRAVAMTWAIAIVLAFFAGLVFEAYADAEASRHYPAPGTFVEMGGRRLHLICIGQGEPVVLFEQSGFGNATSGSRARERISSRTRVCSYDRMGMGWSDAGPSVASFDDLARDLAVLQDRAKIPSPLVIVASSIGGMTAETFARRFPERVAGLVFVDAANSEMLPIAAQWGTPLKVGACVAAVAARFGLIRVIDPFGLNVETSDDARQAAAITYGARPWATMCAMARGISKNLHWLDDVPPLRNDVPLVVLSASTSDQMFPGSQWFEDVRTQRIPAHQRFAKRSTQGVWKMVPKSTHLIANSQPDAVSDAVISMLDQLKQPAQAGVP